MRYKKSKGQKTIVVNLYKEAKNDFDIKKKLKTSIFSRTRDSLGKGTGAPYPPHHP